MKYSCLHAGRQLLPFDEAQLIVCDAETVLLHTVNIETAFVFDTAFSHLQLVFHLLPADLDMILSLFSYLSSKPASIIPWRETGLSMKTVLYTEDT